LSNSTALEFGIKLNVVIVSLCFVLDQRRMREIVAYLTRLRLCQDKIEKLKQREVLKAVCCARFIKIYAVSVKITTLYQ